MTSTRGAPVPTLLAFGTPLAALLVIAGVYLPRYYFDLELSFIAVVAAITTDALSTSFSLGRSA